MSHRSETKPRGTHASTWVFGIIAALVLYVALWPVIDIATLRSQTVRLDVSSSGGPYPSFAQIVTIPARPAWVRTLYYPLIQAQDTWPGQGNPIVRYWNWYHQWHTSLTDAPAAPRATSHAGGAL